MKHLIRMIATDLDGTLLAGRHNLPDENVRALRRAMAAGVKLVIASGRMIEATNPIADKIGVNAPMTLLNGALIYERASDRILGARRIPRALAARVLARVESLGYYMQAFPGRGFLYATRSEWTDYYESGTSVRGICMGRALSEALDADVCKLLCLDQGAQTDALLDRLAPEFPELSFVKSGDTHLEMIARGVDKASGVAEIARGFGIAPEEILAFGDEQNDLSLLNYAGVGYVMDNAPAAVRAAIPRVAPANTDCGVARIVNLYLDEHRMGGR